MSTKKNENITDLESLCSLAKDAHQRFFDPESTTSDEILSIVRGYLYVDDIIDLKGCLLIPNVKFSQDQREAISALFSCDVGVVCQTIDRIYDIVWSVLPDDLKLKIKTREKVDSEMELPEEIRFMIESAVQATARIEKEMGIAPDTRVLLAGDKKN